MKCKVKENLVTNKVRWWFVLHGSEILLCDLEESGPGELANLLEARAMLQTI